MNYVDWIFPHLEGDQTKHDKDEQEKLDARQVLVGERVAALPSDTGLLNSELGTIERLLDQEQSRKASIDTRLISIVGLVSVAGTVVLTGLFALASGTLPFADDWIQSVLSVSCLYLTLQLFAALFAATMGLTRASYPVETALDVLPRPDTSLNVFLRERIVQTSLLSEEHRLINNRKLSLLTVAHVALKNFLCGLLFLACLTTVVAVTMSPHGQRSQSCLESASNRCERKTPDVGKDGDASPKTADARAVVAPPNTSATPDHEFSIRDIRTPLVLVAAGIAISVAGLVTILFNGVLRLRAFGTTLVVSGLGLSFFGGSKFELVGLKFDRLIGQLEFRISDGHKPPNTRIQFSRVITVGPFQDGFHKLNEKAVLGCIGRFFGTNRAVVISGWQIIGRVDKRQLRSDVASRYGSNQSLAMARASWVHDQLSAGVPNFDSRNALVSIGGATSIGSAVTVNELKSDRVVDVYVFWSTSSQQDAAAARLIPAICPGTSNDQE